MGAAVGILLYVNRVLENPAKLVQKPVQDLLAYDFYTPKLYRNTFVLGVDLASRVTDWLDPLRRRRAGQCGRLGFPVWGRNPEVR